MLVSGAFFLFLIKQKYLKVFATMPLPVVFGFYNESAAAKTISLPLRRKKAHFSKLYKTAIYNFIYYSAVDFFIIPCYNISVKDNQKTPYFIVGVKRKRYRW